MHKIKLNYFLPALLLVSTICLDKVSAMAQPGNKSEMAAFPHKVVSDIDKANFPEPSGICYHPTRKTLFVVGDEGHLGELKTDGTVVKSKLVSNADFEGITCNPATGLLYIAVEGKENILEVDPDSFDVLREFDIERHFNGKLLMNKKGNGIEAITFVPNEKHQHGGTFYVANQANKLDYKDDISAVFEVEVPLKGREKTAKAKIKRYFSIGTIDMAALHYDHKTQNLLIVSDEKNSLFEVTQQGVVVNSYILPGIDQEGITIDSDGFIYIAQDSGGIIKIKPKLEK